MRARRSSAGAPSLSNATFPLVRKVATSVRPSPSKHPRSSALPTRCALPTLTPRRNAAYSDMPPDSLGRRARLRRAGAAAALDLRLGRARRDEPGLIGEDHGLHAAREAELGEHATDVALDRALLKMQVGGDVGVAAARRDPEQHVALARGQAGE